MPNTMAMSKERSFGERLREVRRTRGWSQEDTARVFGVRVGAIARWESGDRTPSGPAYKLLEQLEAEITEGEPEKATRLSS